MNINEIETPALVVDQVILERNLRTMADYCREHDLALRPHTKTHKIPQIAKLQVENGACGITVAKLSEAEVMAAAGMDDIVVVYPLWGKSKWQRLARLAEQVRIAVAMDSLAIAEGISRAAKEANVEIGVRLEFDTGFGRCGLPIEQESAEIARRVMDLPHLRWEGISFYPGHIMGDRESRETAIETENRQLDRMYHLFGGAAIPYSIVSGGNTPAAFDSHRFHGVTEIRPGTYVFNDRNTVDAQAATYADCAATVLATVVSTSVPQRAIIDAGSKMFSGDQLLSGERKYFGWVQDRAGLILEDLSEEHGHLNLAANSSIQVGDRIRVVPNHICPSVNLQDKVYVVSGDQVVDEWTVAGRGKVS
jgi:D-serine deaminase-like pyridoxal phosphate-dependent protein